MQKKTYTIEEVQELMDPLFKQIEFYQDQYLQSYYFISKLPGWVKFLLPGRFLNYYKKTSESFKETKTLISQILEKAENFPGGWDEFKKYYQNSPEKSN